MLVVDDVTITPALEVWVSGKYILKAPWPASLADILLCPLHLHKGTWTCTHICTHTHTSVHTHLYTHIHTGGGHRENDFYLELLNNQREKGKAYVIYNIHKILQKSRVVFQKQHRLSDVGKVWHRPPATSSATAALCTSWQCGHREVASP